MGEREWDELVAWYRQQLDADEVAALRAGGGRWQADGREITTADGGGTWVLGQDGDPVAIARHAFAEGGEPLDPRSIAWHIAGQDPEQVLARVEAQRGMLDAAVEEVALDEQEASSDPELRSARHTWEFAVRWAAAGYRHRPGWKEVWEPPGWPVEAAPYGASVEEGM
ncbi:DUF6221 family protein [Nocardiopsis sp. FR26]|uniref:DUF6221 family protein n=1 Tax=Nocardiopsis sp. FR26 TaxID=2605987 RepID=UPI00135B3F60|nr:DUF6221 family protein [Nocardiopsis sp. FR26]